MEQERKHAAEHEAKDKLVEELVKRNELDVPEALVNGRSIFAWSADCGRCSQQGMRTEDIKKMDFERLRAGQREQALSDVKAQLLLEKVAEEEKIEVSERGD